MTALRVKKIDMDQLMQLFCRGDSGSLAPASDGNVPGCHPERSACPEPVEGKDLLFHAFGD